MPINSLIVRWLASLRPLKARFGFGNLLSRFDSWIGKIKPLGKKLPNYPTTSFKSETLRVDDQLPNFRSAFTLIELLIVITIIGILATAILASFGGAQEKTRDGRRKSDLAQVKRAMELAKSDCKGAAYYPYQSASVNTNAAAAYDELLKYMKEEKYISAKPTDPKDEGLYRYSYFTTSTPTMERCPPQDNTTGKLLQYGIADYVMYTMLERTSDSDAYESRTKICADKPTFDGGAWGDSNHIGYYVICNN